MLSRRLPTARQTWRRAFSGTPRRCEILDAASLPDRIIPRYQGRMTFYMENFIDILQKALPATFFPYNGPLLPETYLLLRKTEHHKSTNPYLSMLDTFIQTTTTSLLYLSQELLHRSTSTFTSQSTLPAHLIRYRGRWI